MFNIKRMLNTRLLFNPISLAFYIQLEVLLVLKLSGSNFQFLFFIP